VNVTLHGNPRTSGVKVLERIQGRNSRIWEK